MSVVAEFLQTIRRGLDRHNAFAEAASLIPLAAGPQPVFPGNLIVVGDPVLEMHMDHVGKHLVERFHGIDARHAEITDIINHLDVRHRLAGLHHPFGLAINIPAEPEIRDHQGNAQLLCQRQALVQCRVEPFVALIRGKVRLVVVQRG